ncbi:cell death regulator Aven isoform X2 [Lathamus discolor]|uniref:cell death regulator Aven isoform X2 n=1 Tax=Lathamus discolor TaxID=678569 RepID=UPI0032B869C1
MQPERGGGLPRREGGRHGRRRPNGAEKAADAATEGSSRDCHGGDGSRARGGAAGHRGGGRRGRREPRGRGATPPAAQRPRRVEEDDDTESQEEEEKEELKSYSRRKIVSNWSRYEDAEKEGQNEHGETQRGTDFSVLLSSAGDFLSQFRFADEKEWDRESTCHKQASTPEELPQMKSKIIKDGKKRELLFRQAPAQSETVLVSHATGNSDAPPEPGSKNGPRTTAEPFKRGHPLSKQETDHLDEELDLLLNLDAPIDKENSLVSEALSYNISTEKMLKMDCKENNPLKLDMPEEKSPASKQQQSTSKTVTEEELEEWLDSMIS